MATIQAQGIPHAGADVTMAAAAGGGDNFAIAEGNFLIIRNGGGTDCVVTLAVVNTVDGLVTPNRTFTVNASDISIIPMIGLYANASDGLCHVTYSQVTSVTVGLVNVQR